MWLATCCFLAASLQSIWPFLQKKGQVFSQKSYYLYPSRGLGHSGRTSSYCTGNPLDINCPGLEALREPDRWLSAKKGFAHESKDAGTVADPDLELRGWGWGWGSCISFSLVLPAFLSSVISSFFAQNEGGWVGLLSLRSTTTVYYMSLACGRYNVRFDWLIVTEL